MKIEYLNNEVFEKIINRFNDTKDNLGENSQEFIDARVNLAEAFYLLAKNIIRAFRFQLVDKDDSLQEGVLICFEKLHRFDAKKGRGFNFFTTVLLNHMRQLYRTAKNYNELKLRYRDHLAEKVSNSQTNAMKAKRKTSSYKRDAEINDQLDQ